MLKPRPRRNSRRPAVDARPASLAWSLRYLPHFFTDEPSSFHVELMRDLEDPARRLIARVAPRGHAKSTCAALAYPLWCVCRQQRRNIVMITHELSLATQFVRDIRTELESNERILAEYGELCAPPEGQERGPAGRRRRPKWSESIFTTATGITVQARSAGGSFRGVRAGPHRPDLIICDDVENDEHVESPEGRRKLERWLRSVVMPALAPDGRLVVVGSLIHHDSLLASLRDPERFPGWNYRVYRALEARNGEDGLHERQALWPARWPVEKLEDERRRIGTPAFEQEYQANPIDESARVFRPEWLRRCEESEVAALESRGRLATLIAVDPATGVSGGDFFALWAGSVDAASGIIYTRALTLERIGIVAQVRRVVAAFERWRPVTIGIEATAYQVALQQILEEESRRRGLYLPIVPIRSTSNKQARIEGSAPFYENGVFRLPASLDPEAEAQFLHFPKAGHDDAPDVCAMGIELARELRSGPRVDGMIGGRRMFTRRGGW